MATKSETVHPVVHHVVTGHFHEGRGYENWRARGTDSWLLIYTLRGVGRFGQEPERQLTQMGDMILLRPGACHDYGTAPEPGAWELLWAHFHPRPHWHEWLAWPEAAPDLMLLPLGEPVLRRKIEGRLAEMHRLATGALRQREEFAMNALEEVLLWCSAQNPRSEQARLDPRITACLERLCQNLSAPLTLDSMARDVGLSVSRLAHLFRAQVGQTPQQFLEQQRLERAQQMLELSGRSISDIAAEVGYENPFYFTLRFKKWTGLSPRDYRRKQAQSAPVIPDAKHERPD